MAFSLLSVGARAMSANYAALQTTSNNIANANVEGYSRQQVNLKTAPGQPSGRGFLGSGVDVGSITRAHDAFLTREAATANSQASFDSTHLDLLSQMESVFATGDSGVGAAASNFFTALSDLASHPGDTAARQTVLSRAGELAQRFSTAGQHLDALQSDVVSELRTSVDAVNGLSSGLAQLNDEIVHQQGLGQSPNDLLDRRDQLVQQLSSYLQVTTVASPNGALAVFTAGGQRLVLGGEAQKLEVAADKLDGSRATVALREAGGSVIPIDSGLLAGGGSVGALLAFQNDDLVAARNTLGQMALATAARTNEQQTRGLDLGIPPGAGQAIFTDFVQQSLAGDLKALPAQGNSSAANVDIHITDASLLEADEYTLEAQADGVTFLMTRASDGERFSYTATAPDGSQFTRASSGEAFHPGFTLQLNGAAAAGDHFLVQPVARAASQLQRVLDDPRGIAAASPPLKATASATNSGTATVSGLTVAGGGFGSDKVKGQLSFTNAKTDGSFDWSYAWTRTSADGTATTGTQTGTWNKDQPLSVSGFDLKLSGLPAVGDAIDVVDIPSVGNGNAKALAALSSESFVGRDWKDAGNTGGSTLTNAYASALSSVGTRVQSAQVSSDISTDVATEALAQRDNRSGVDLDEEAAKLLAYQKSYQAAAKVLQVAQSVFDTLLEATSGR